jgi:hypothetical protein
MRLTIGVDWAPDLGDPQLDAVMAEDREDQLELCAGEGSLRFADDKAAPSAGRVGNVGKKAGGLGAAAPGQRAAYVDVVVHGHDDPAVRLNQLIGEGELPATGVFR